MSILDELRSGGLQNPIAKEIQSQFSTTSILSSAEMIVLATAQSASSGIPKPPDGTIVAAQASFVSTYNTIADMIGHTDRISGVNLTGNGTLATIAKTMGAARSINGENTCDKVLGAFGSLHKQAEVINDIKSALNQYQEYIANIPAKIGVVSAVVAIKDKLVAQIASDVATLAEAQQDIVEHSIASALTSLVEDECLSTVMKSVMKQSMLNAVEEERYKLLSTIRTARYGFPS